MNVWEKWLDHWILIMTKLRYFSNLGPSERNMRKLDTLWCPFRGKEINLLNNYHMQDVLMPRIGFLLHFKITWYLHYNTYFKQIKNWGLVFWYHIYIWYSCKLHKKLKSREIKHIPVCPGSVHDLSYSLLFIIFSVNLATLVPYLQTSLLSSSHPVWMIATNYLSG